MFYFVLIEDLAMRIVETYYLFHGYASYGSPKSIPNQADYGLTAIWLILYISFIMATTILCTLLIIYRIITISYRGMGIRTFRGIIEIIVESALIYSITLLIYIVLIIRHSFGGSYIDVFAASARVCLCIYSSVLWF